jgi:hypothetical protein
VRVVTLSVTPTYFRFHVRFFRSHSLNGHASPHDYSILGISSLSLSLAFIIHCHRSVCVHLYKFRHTHTHTYTGANPPSISAYMHTKKCILTFLFFLFVLTVYNYQRTVIMAHDKKWIRISSTFPFFPYLSHTDLTPSHTRTCVL